MLEIRDPAFREMIADTAPLIRIAGGFGFTEGPIWHPDEHWLMFSDIAESCQYRWSAAAGLSVFRRPSNQANGNAFDAAGRIVTCEHASSQVVRHDHDGKWINPIATHYRDHALNSPNDVIVDRRGRIWFTDPAFGRLRADLGRVRDQELSFQGVYRLDPDGILTLVADDFRQPNGLCLSPDGMRLFVNDSWDPTIRVFDIADDGSLTGARPFATVAGTGEGVPDGMKTDRTGRVLCNGPGGVHVFAPDGRPLGVIRTPEKSTNFCFGGAAHASLFITASTSVYRIETETAGLPMIPR